MAANHDQDRTIALETIKAWLEEHDASYLAKENVIIHWEQFDPESRKGEWIRLKMPQICRIIKATRAGFHAMRLINADLVMLAAQELERAYKQAASSRSTLPDEYFNLCRQQSFTNYELLTLSTLQELVGRGWNVEALCLGDILIQVFTKHGYKVPSRTLRWRLIRSVAGDAGILVRDRKDRITISGVGRFVAVQVEGITDSIKLELSELEMAQLLQDVAIRYSKTQE